MSASAAETTLRETLPGRVAAFARTRGAEVALRVKERGIWREFTWSDYLEAIAAVGHALDGLGVGPGDHVAVLSDNRPEWLFADLGAQGLGARTVGIYQTNPAPDVAWILQHSQSKVIFCEDQEQVDKVLEVAGETPTVAHVVVFDPRGTRGYTDPRLMSWETLLARGREARRAAPGWFEARLQALDRAAPCMVVYTSGTTGTPKGALLSHQNVAEPTDRAVEFLGIRRGDAVLSYLPLCHVAEKIFSLYLPLSVGTVVHFGESIATVQEDLKEVSPTVFLGVPRIWEKMHNGIVLKMKNSSPLKRWLFQTFSRWGEARARRGGAWSITDRLVGLVGDVLVYRPLQERLGMRRCRYPLSGAAPISPDLLYFFHGIGIPVAEAYGQTECTGVSHANVPPDIRIGTVGRPLPHCEQHIAEDGEILVRGPHVFVGYLHDPEATARTVDTDGWLHTGDVGEIVDGFLKITGRKKEIIITSGGKNLSPEKIENVLKMSPLIKEAVAIGDARNYVSALIQADGDAVADWATRRGIAFTSYEDLVARPEVVELIAAEVRRLSDHLAQVEQVRAFRLFPRELHQDEGELTPTQKVRRRFIHQKYADLIEAMYQKGGGAT